MLVYCLTNLRNGKHYVGITRGKNANIRMKNHMSICKYPIGRALRKYGISSFKLRVIDIAHNFETLEAKEKFWIHVLDCMSPKGYNLTIGGGGIENPPRKTREKIRAYQLKRWRKTSNSRKAEIITPALRALEAAPKELRTAWGRLGYAASTGKWDKEQRLKHYRKTLGACVISHEQRSEWGRAGYVAGLRKIHQKIKKER
jgi:group I intron endonuclease